MRTGLEYVPRRKRKQLVQHLLENTVAPGGRLIIGAHSEIAASEPRLEAEVASWGFCIAGRVETPHAEDYRIVRRAFWIERSA